MSRKDEQLAELDRALEELRDVARGRRADRERRTSTKPSDTGWLGVSLGTRQTQAVDEQNGKVTTDVAYPEHQTPRSRLAQLWRAMIRRIRH